MLKHISARPISTKVAEQRELSEKTRSVLPKMRGYFKWMNPSGYSKASTVFKKHVGGDGDGDPRAFGLMMDHSYSLDSHSDLADQMEGNWVEINGDHLASKINFAQVIGDKQVEEEAWKQANAMESTHRLERLRTRSNDSLVQTRTRTIYATARYGLVEESHAIFSAVEDADLATSHDYEARLWSCGSYAKQLEFWQQMEKAATKSDWSPGVESFTAILWQLQLENNPEEMVKVFEHIQDMGIRPNDRMLHALQRAGERFQQLRKETLEDRMPWQSVFVEPAPRLRVGL